MASANGMVVQKRMSFLASLVWGVCSLMIVLICCVTGIVIVGMNQLSGRINGVFDLAEHVVAEVPSIVKSLPPVFADALSDRRAPDYRDQLDVKIDFSNEPHENGWIRPVVVVNNQGSEVVSWLTIRVVVRDDQGNIIKENAQMVASPLALDGDVPGPIMPGSVRRMAGDCFQKSDDLTAEYEITDIRVWVKTPESIDSEEPSNKTATSQSDMPRHLNQNPRFLANNN